MKTMRKTICYNCGPKMDGVSLYDFCEFEIDKVIFSFSNNDCKVRIPCVKKEYITGLMLQSNIRGYYKILMIEKEFDENNEFAGFQIKNDYLYRSDRVRLHKKLDNGIILFCKNISDSKIAKDIIQNIYLGSKGDDNAIL